MPATFPVVRFSVGGEAVPIGFFSCRLARFLDIMPGMRRPARRSGISFSFEDEARRAGFRSIAGVDEAGRGCLAGPVFAAAVVLDPARPISGVNDSKALSVLARERLFEAICEHALAWSTAAVGSDLIDRWNILRATHEAMRRAAVKLRPAADFLLIDGLPVPETPAPHKAIVAGDSLSYSIAAASIVAKVTRDRWMRELDDLHPGYGFARHKGYPTEEHLRALRQLGPSPVHRLTFRGVLPGTAGARQTTLPLLPA